MEVGGKFSILVIYTGFSEDIEHDIRKAAGREPINESYDLHESKRILEFQYKTEQSTRAARSRMVAATKDIEPRWARPWISPVREDEYVRN